MKRARPVMIVLTLAALGALVAVRPLPGLALVGGMVVVTLLFVAWPVSAIALPFLIVQALGENFRIPLLPVAATQASYALVGLAVAQRGFAGMPRLNGALDRGVAAFALTLVPATVLALAAGATASWVKGDIAPLLFLLMTYGATRTLVRTTVDLDIVFAAMTGGMILAAAKVAYLAGTPLAIDWNSWWQAVRIPEGAFTRVILRGGDVFFVAIGVVAFARLIAAPHARLRDAALGALACLGTFYAGTRSNWLGFVAGLAAVALIAGKTARGRTRVCAGGILALALLGAVLLSSDALPRLLGRVAQASSDREWTVDFRRLESAGALAAIARDGALGSGLGATYRYWDASAQVVVETGFNHNGFLQLLMKTGIVGLVVFLFILYRMARIVVATVDRDGAWVGRLVGLFGGVVAILVLSLGVNKIFSLSGAMFMGFAFAVAQTAADAVAPTALEAPAAGSPHEQVVA